MFGKTTKIISLLIISLVFCESSYAEEVNKDDLLKCECIVGQSQLAKGPEECTLYRHCDYSSECKEENVSTVKN